MAAPPAPLPHQQLPATSSAATPSPAKKRRLKADETPKKPVSTKKETPVPNLADEDYPFSMVEEHEEED
eukprot:3458382-Amphidinium_carterae.1